MKTFNDFINEGAGSGVIFKFDGYTYNVEFDVTVTGSKLTMKPMKQKMMDNFDYVEFSMESYYYGRNKLDFNDYFNVLDISNYSALQDYIFDKNEVSQFDASDEISKFKMKLIDVLKYHGSINKSNKFKIALDVDVDDISFVYGGGWSTSSLDKNKELFNFNSLKHSPINNIRMEIIDLKNNLRCELVDLNTNNNFVNLSIVSNEKLSDLYTDIFINRIDDIEDDD